MYPCLQIAEIQSEIFIHLLAEDTPTLATLARTCKTLTETALDLLWYDQETLAPLIQVLPNDLWVIDTDMNEEGEIYQVLVCVENRIS